MACAVESRRLSRRATLVTSFAVVLLSAPVAARADTCAVVQADAFEIGTSDSVDPSLLETADPVSVESASAPAIPRAPHLLCTSSSDPRCSPLEASNTPTSPDMPARIDVDLSDAMRVPSVALRQVTFGTPPLMGPACAPGTTLDRPPRG